MDTKAVEITSNRNKIELAVYMFMDWYREYSLNINFIKITLTKPNS